VLIEYINFHIDENPTEKTLNGTGIFWPLFFGSAGVYGDILVALQKNSN
jgi:hypothetical protein